MSTSGNKIQNLEYYSRINKKIRKITNIIAIFILFSFLILGPTASFDIRLFGQSNETSLPSENVAQIIPKNQPEEENEIIEDEESSLSEQNSSSSSSDSESGSGEQNTVNETSQKEEGIAEISDSQPDGDCLFDPSLPKCAPDENGNCPEGFARNGDDQCFPRHDRCPEEYHSHEDDESGRCIPDDVPCDPGYIMNPDYPSCENKDRVCQEYPELDDCKRDDDNGSTNLAYRSGYNHGCSDAQIPDPDNRYINQLGKGANYHTSEFMRGYNDGFERCLDDNTSSPPSSNSKGTFKVIVIVTNHLLHDLSGGITVSVDHSPENIVRSSYGIYFPGGETVSKTFTFKSSDVPVGTEFEVNLDYGDDHNQYKLGENSPEKRPEIVQFVIQ
ncbi:hypothetical protein [Candidatus Nitrosocosmicus hydrocola]|uniref:hypothetical protein n=1 Tax=Candidatus Nitrosocosmicus hydrocola TaxID=1826872 RepID=UPI0011E5D093|nr:hypothetical protein [Candidatus Nitrosocosmicus hydrocola]